MGLKRGSWSWIFWKLLEVAGKTTLYKKNIANTLLENSIGSAGSNDSSLPLRGAVNMAWWKLKPSLKNLSQGLVFFQRAWKEK